jgi:predicted RNase H-like nuclease (RuvC/YqgF family)
VSQFNTSPGLDLSGEVLNLRQQLACRDQLVEQLSQELYRVIIEHPDWFLPAQAKITEGLPLRESAVGPQQVQVLQQQMQELEKQIGFYQQQIAHRDAELVRLRESVQEMGDRNQMLEKVIQELPEVYRQKFTERLAQIKAKVEALQRENRQLQAELQNINYLAIARTNPEHPTEQVDLPNFPPLEPHRVRTVSKLDDL